MTLAEYIPAANHGVVCVVQIESRAGVQAAAEIAAVPGVDCIFVGLSDLSVDLGCPGQYAHPDLDAALDTIIAAARPHGPAIGIPIADMTRVDEYRSRGVSLFTTTDRGIVANGMAGFRSHF
jgi:2-dehydro-3-deoxyglucarate aldolase